MSGIIYIYLLFFLLVINGCSSQPLQGGPDIPNTVIEIQHFAQSKHNKYALILEGHNSTYKIAGPNQGFDNDRLDRLSQPIKDPCIKRDVSETSKLAISKGYDVYLVRNLEEFDQIAASLELASDDATQLLIAMSGEGDDKGFIFNLVHITDADGTPGPNFVPPGMKLTCNYFAKKLDQIHGTKAIVINACQSGCFAEELRKDTQFQGVVITACPIGYATTDCQKTQTSAIFAGFLGLYQDNPKEIRNLSTAHITAGSWFENFRHKFSDIGAGGLSISYDPVIYSTAEFLF